MLIFLYGQESFLVHQKREELKQKFQSKYPSAKVDTFDMEEEARLEPLRESLSQGGGLFSNKNFVDLRNPLSLTAVNQEKLRDILKQQVEKSPDCVVVVSQLDIKDKKSKLLKYLKEKTQSQELKKLDGARLKTWIASQVAGQSENKLKIHPAAVEKLVLITQGDLWKLNSEIKKLVNFQETGEITVVEVNQLCQGEAETKIFDLVDAIAQRNQARANELVYHLLEAGENEFYLFTMLLFQFRNLLRVKDCQKKGIFSPQAISKSLNIHPYVVTKALNQLRNFSLDKLKEIYDLAAQLDVQVKTGEKSMQECLTYFICRV